MRNIVLVILLLLSSGIVLPSQAKAQIIGVPISTLADLYSTMENRKNFGLNQLAFLAAKRVLHEITASTVRWINSGFQGSPVFIRNPKAFFLYAADQATGEFLSSNGVTSEICSPWSVDVRLALALNQGDSDINGTMRRNYTCTLGTIINNAQNATINGRSIRGFMNGDFNQGGWPAFIEISANTRNTPAGSYLQASADLRTAVAGRKTYLSEDLNRGKGFLSISDCSSYEDDSGQTQEDCTTQTPGSVIAETLQKQLNVPADELLLANDINSVVNALVSQMISQMLTKGLAALSSGGSGVSGGAGGNRVSLTSQIYNEAVSAKTVSLGGSSITTTNQTLVSIRDKYTQAITLLTTSETNLTTAKNCFINNGQSGSSEVSSIDSIIRLQITPILAALRSNLSIVNNQINGSTANSTLTLPATTNIDDSTTAISDAVNSYEAAFQTAVSQTSNMATAQATAEGDYANTQKLSTNLNSQAEQFMKDCEAL